VTPSAISQAARACNCRLTDSSFYLRGPAEYRKLAQDSIPVAEAAGIPRDKALSAVSQTWLRPAEEAEANQSS
jgi:hypothetical protein